jgi:hypothetical protein
MGGRTRPQRIVAEPVVEKAGGRRLVMRLLCDDGRWWRLDELAPLLGIGAKALYNRIREKGWDHQHVLADATERGAMLGGGHPGPGGGNDEWARLSTRPRTRNLKLIGPVGSWEQGR